jgi:hypothetical protein
MKRLDVIEALGDCSHLDHTVAVVNIKALDFSTSKSWLAIAIQPYAEA